jgi:hypothetical protein
MANNKIKCAVYKSEEPWGGGHYFLPVDKHENLILFTMRGGQELVDAVKWFHDREIPLYAVNTNPEQLSWTDSPKVHSQLYIDDHGIGCPTGIEVITPGYARLFVDWEKINEILIDTGFLV